MIPCSANDDIVTVTLTEQALTFPGIAHGEVRILSEGKVLTSTMFEFFIRENIIENSIPSSSEYKELERLINESQKITQELIQAKESLSNIDDIKAELTGLNEITQGLINSLEEKQTEVGNLAQTITEKVQETEDAISNLDAIKPEIDELKALITQAQSLNSALEDLRETVNSANAAGGEIKSKVQIIEGWIANPEQFKGEKGDPGPQGPQGEVGPQGERGEVGPRGLQGEQGIQGERGEIGPQGEKGDMGTGIEILGSFTSESQLPSGASLGDAYMISGFLWVYDGTKWVNAGQIQGAKGDKGDTGDTGEKGDTGATFTPTVNVDGDISWANDKGLANPTTRNIRGPQGPQGPQGPAGDNATTTAVATPTTNGLMSSADKTKLDGVDAGANNYTHPANHPASMITESSTKRFVTDAEKSTWNGKQDKLTAGTNVTISGNTISATDTTYGVASASANGLMSSAMFSKLNGLYNMVYLTESAFTALGTKDPNTLYIRPKA